MKKVNEQLLEELIYNKRSVGSFTEEEVTEEVIKKLYELTSVGATAFNAQPARYIFIKSQEAKERIKPFLMAGNVDKVMKAPLTVIVATDYNFYDLLHKTFPIADIKGLFTSNKEMSDTTAFRNATLSGGYMISNAHILGLDTGAMSGFDNAALDNEFFKGTNIRSNFIINIGYGIYDDLPPRLSRLSFDEVGSIL